MEDLKRAINNCKTRIAEIDFNSGNNIMARRIRRAERKTLETAVSAMQELLQYLNTGLTPAQIRKMDELYQEKCRELAEYKRLEEQGKLLKLPVAIGGKVYEITAETIPERYFYIGEYEVQDVSATSVKYCGDWIPLDYDTLYFSREAAEKALEEMKNGV